MRMSKPARVIVIAAALAIPTLARKPGEPIKPGFNRFTKQQDIQRGQQAAAEVRRQSRPVSSPELQDYIRRIGEQLAATPDVRDSGFQFTFTLVNDKSINAFALPGGPTFIHTGLILAADNEAQIAGVLGNELFHVILRHGTNQYSKANMMQIP